ncbi:MAG: hypothetical protein A2920_02030 [Candidatus Zambryskibacteria bacterium RIFCSPLOWO2_01_FULL_43_17]|uniref:Carbohydrate kinase PfkB domain-containing protein n=1 Tax=Candidatus Zambryskibacteria bacterium RIFCSPLOWO2_01_FULL_43_17 TaxID=1802760 RepID=A0A1G2U6V1_9BACT|nr:MAG: hypothetical protein A2920_02030 [Candidatus Zambryskibacteria bacterium RIFCSPLOWO2_01_FULL_43_17]
MSKDYDFIAIGDITTDAFIRLKNASVHCDVDRENCEICMTFGDKIPYDFVEVVRAVGNSPNAAVSATRLGLTSALVSNLGDDENGRECLDTLKKNGVSLEFMRVHENKKTNYHYVLWYEDERTILIKHEEFDYSLPQLGAVKWIYLSSMGSTSENFHREIADYLVRHPDVKLAFQPGTFQFKLGYKKLRTIYEHTEVFFCNVNEAHRVLEKEGKIEIIELLKGIHGLGPKIVVITDGAKGAYTYDGNSAYFMPPYPDPNPPFERTGAGDAFASTFTSALVLGKGAEEALMWAPINSMAVVQQIGAQKGLLTREQLEKYLKDAPESYRPKLLS